MADDQRQVVEGPDYYIEAGRWVFTREYHLKRGFCCGSGCRHCPYKDSGATCPNCGKSFACQPEECWCEKVKVPVEALIEMRELFTGCVCPDCLRGFAEKAEAAASGTRGEGEGGAAAEGDT